MTLVGRQGCQHTAPQAWAQVLLLRAHRIGQPQRRVIGLQQAGPCQIILADQRVADCLLHSDTGESVFHPVDQAGQRVAGLVRYRSGQHRGGHGVVPDDPDHLFHQVFFNVDVVAPVRNRGFKRTGHILPVLEPQRTQHLLHLFNPDIHSQDFFQPRRGHRHRAATGMGIWEDIYNTLRYLSAGHLPDQLCRASQGNGRQLRIEALFKTQRRFGVGPQFLGGPPVVLAVEGSRFQQHRGGFRAYLAVCAAYNSADSYGVVGIGYHQHFRRELAFHSVQSSQRFAGPRPPDNDGAVLEAVVIESMEGLVVLQHHVVGHIDHVVDGPQAGFGQPVLKPTRRRADGHSSDKAGGVTVAQVRIGHADGDAVLNWRAVVGVADVRLPHRPPGQRAHFPGDTQYGKTVQAVGGQLQVQDRVPQVLVQIHPGGSIFGQHHNTFMVVAQAQFQFRANHSLGYHTPDPSRFQSFLLAGVTVVQRRANLGEADLLPGGYVWGATDHLHLFDAGGHLAEGQAISLRMGLD